MDDQTATISLETQHDIFANHTMNCLDALETNLCPGVVRSILWQTAAVSGAGDETLRAHDRNFVD